MDDQPGSIVLIEERIRIDGDLDPHTSQRLLEVLGPLLADPAVQEVKLDLEGTRFMDSSGLRVLIDAHDALTERGARLALCSPSPAVLRLLEITDLHDHFTIA